MKKFLVVIAIILCACIICGRPALCAVVDSEKYSFASPEMVLPGLPGEVFLTALLPVAFVREYVEQGLLGRCSEGYFLISRGRPPPKTCVQV